MKLAIFIEQIFWHDGVVYSTDESYILFAASFIHYFETVTFIGRVSPEAGRKPYVLDQAGLEVCPIPYYEKVSSTWKAGPQLFKDIRATIDAHAADWDLILIGGPNPIAQFVATCCIDRKRPIALVVRQNLVSQVCLGYQGLTRYINTAFALWLEWRFRRLATGRTVFTVGEEMAREYSTYTPHVHTYFASLISDAQLAAFENMRLQSQARHLLIVGRLSSEKGHAYLFQAIAALKARGIICTLDVVGSGDLDAELRALAKTLGLDDTITFHSYVPYGPELFALYQKATALVVSSITEGFPQVINEALCIGLPVIATTVGGIPAFLKHGETALLIAPAQVNALIAAIVLIIDQPALREHLRRQGQALMHDNTLEANRDRIIQALYNEVLYIQQ